MGDETSERIGGEAEPSRRPRRSENTRRYDSFVVRVWRNPGTNRLIRADVRHVQSGVSESAIDCDAGWIRDVLDERLSEDGSTGA